MLGSPDPDSSTAFFLKMSSEIRAAFLTAPQFWSLRKKEIRLVLTYLAALSSTSITKSMLGLTMFTKAKARMMEHLSFCSLGGNFSHFVTRICSPSGPISVIVSATDYLLSWPSLSNFSS